MCSSCDDLIHSLGKYIEHERVKPGTAKQFINGETDQNLTDKAKLLISAKQTELEGYQMLLSHKLKSVDNFKLIKLTEINKMIL